MGYFQLLRELDAAGQAQAQEAAALVERAADDMESVIASAWDRIDEPGFIAKLYGELATMDEDLSLGRARVLAAVDGSAEEYRALMSGGLGVAAPLLASFLFTDRKQGAARLLAEVYHQFDRPMTDLLVSLAAGEDAVAFFSLLCLATSPFDEDREQSVALRAESTLPQGWLDALHNRIALAGVDTEDDWVVEQLQGAVRELLEAPEEAVRSGEKRHVRREENSPVGGWCMAAKQRKIAAAVEALCGLLYSFDALEALDAIAAIADARALEAVRAYRASLGGGSYETLPFRLAADNALAAMGDDVSTDSAREVFETYHPKRYGYPKTEHLIAHWTRAVAAYADRGDADELSFACTFATAPWAAVRDAAARAWHKVHGELPELSYWDKTRIEHFAEAEGDDALIEVLNSPLAVYRHLIVEYLIEECDEDLHEMVAQWVAEQLASRPNFYVDGADQLPDDAKAMVNALQECDEDVLESVADSSSSWIQAFVLDGDELEKPSIYTPGSSSYEAKVTSLGTAPFVYGKHINAIAVSPDRAKIAVVGQDFGRIDDIASGQEHAYLELRWNWGYDCAYSPDGARLAVCFHGGHVEIFDAATGQRALDELKGHGGVPNGVKRLAYSPDGTALVTVGQDARVICWEAATGEQRWAYQGSEGSYEAVTWTPDGASIIASHVKTSGGEKNFLSIHDAQTGEARIHELKHSIWALQFSADGKWLAMGGEANLAHLCNPEDFAPQRDLELLKTTRLVFSPDGQFLYGCSEEGTLKRWKMEEGSGGDVLLEGAGQLWSLNVDSDGVVRTIGTKGELHTFVDGEPAEGPQAHVHTKQIKGFEVIDDDVLTASWDGQLLRWPSSGSNAAQLLSVGKRINRIAAIGSDQVALATGAGLRVVDLSTGEVVRETDGDLDAVAVSADGDIAIDAREVLRVLGGDSVTEVTVGSDSISRIAATPDGGWLAGTDAGELSLVRNGKRVWTIADHGADRLEFGAPHKDICDIVMRPGGFITAGNDNTIRVYDWEGGDARPRIRLRIHTYTGIFNALDVSPDGKWLAAPSSGALQIYELDTGKTMLSLPTLEYFGHNALTVPKFLQDGSLLVGTEPGRFFQVQIGDAQ